MNDSSLDIKEVVKSTLDALSQADCKKIVSKLMTHNIVKKEPDLFQEYAVLKLDKSDYEVIHEALDSNFSSTLNIINQILIDKVFKYGSMFEINSEEVINKEYFLPLTLSETLNMNINLIEYEDLYLFVFYETLVGVKLNQVGESEKRYYRYPTIAMVHPIEKILDIKVPTIPRLFHNETRNFYQKRISEIRDFLNTEFDLKLSPLDLFSLTNIISEENDSDVKVSSQKMQLASGGNATLDSGVDSEEIILPILGELIKILDDNKALFNQNEESLKIKDLLEEFISETKETSELPWMSLRWPNQVKVKNMQVKFLFNYYDDAEFTMMQFYNNSRGMEGMRYVAKYLIKKYKSNSSGTSISEN